MNRYDVIIIGGGIMGMMGALEMTRAGLRVAIVDKHTIGNPAAGSSGLTRSLRTDYAQPFYASLAAQSWEKWHSLQQRLGVELLLQTGCLNLACTRGGDQSYAQTAAQWLDRDGRTRRIFPDNASLRAQYPQFRVFDYAVEEQEAGLGFPRTALKAITQSVGDRCALYENTAVQAIKVTGVNMIIQTNTVQLRAAKLVVAAGLGTPAIFGMIAGANLNLPLTPARPDECIYYIPKRPKQYRADRFPIFACLDMGLYGHPIVTGSTKGVKIGRYQPPATVNNKFKSAVTTIEHFVEHYLPDLAAQATIRPVTDTDQCAYDMTPDGGFLVGPLTNLPNIFVATGFCGTGYKFAPVIAELMNDFATGRRPRYGVEVFDPERFNV